MPVYIMLTKLTDKGAETIRENPERILEVDREIQEMGATVREQYATLGEYDFVNILEAPDNVTAEKVSLALASRGTIRIETLPGIPVAELVDRLSSERMAGSGAYAGY
ncbi:MAG: GYD domain-containing protein [Coriobacteriia bacterium]|nr:GYD domain-containing protein [Coriobacteriia bacterium]